MTDLVLPTRLVPGPEYYRAIALAEGPVTICRAERFDKRHKDAHRFTIADTRGPLQLTVPIEKPYGKTWADTAVSLHGRWWEVTAQALESAYGRTPFFEFLRDDFLGLLEPPFGSVADLNEAMDRAVRRALGLQTPVIYSDDPTLRPVAPEPWTPAPYWQVRADRLGFIPGLSILDMVFNLGPEAVALWS